MSTTLDVPTRLAIDPGPVWSAASILIAGSTLNNHVDVTFDGVAEVQHRTDDVPYELWGSATQALWRLLCSMAGRGEVSLYEVASRCDAQNTAVVGEAMHVLFGGER